ncbi:uncharacterized protein LOC128740189 [Sabethes cyaneus]|uniref:uncharacterized protein LOC128740189 n=1 Tax=Sabethes cyaneus TaxID=53552 RepID=UPI00237DDDA9|nr:uncharacterized protein LOC128740189 [Sabethes cyaneus]
MLLRSGNSKRKILFSTPVGSLASSTIGFSRAETVKSPETNNVVSDFATTPIISVRAQKEEQQTRQKQLEMAESIAALEQCLIAVRGKVERIRRAIEARNQDHGKFSYHGLKLYVETTVAAYNEYNSLQNRIYIADPTRRVEFENKFIDFEEVYEFVRISLAEMIQAHEDTRKEIVKRSESVEVQSIYQQGELRAQPIVPSLLLQQMPLPTFDGRYENWHKYKDRFRDIVDKCTGDSPATKLHYLDKALVGKAQGAIDQQTLNDNNYEGAWRILTKRFENLRMVVQGHITQLLSLKMMARESHAELNALLDVVEKRLESLEFHNLKMEDGLSEAILVNLVISKLDSVTRRDWEATVEHGKLPVFKDTINFLRERCYMLERCEVSANSARSRTQMNQRSGIPSTLSKVHAATVQQANCCLMCNKEHLLDMCESFKRLTVNSRYAKAKLLGLCFLCLKRGHRTVNCKIDDSKWCECKNKHHPLMHLKDKATNAEASTSKIEIDTSVASCTRRNEEPPTVAKCEVPATPATATRQVLLATAIVEVIDAGGVAHNCRALLDSGAMANFVSERMCDVLSLSKHRANVPIVGVNGTRTTVKFMVNATVKSKTTDFEFSMDYLVVPRVTGALPSLKLDFRSWPIPPDLKLADPKFFEPSRIDMLLGAEIFFELMKRGKIRMSAELPLLQESFLGWLITGPVCGTWSAVSVQNYHVAPNKDDNEELNELMKRFWMIDQQMNEPLEMDECERHFKSTYTRGGDGRYIVKLPFRKSVDELGDSRAQAERRFKALENRLEKCPETKLKYVNFIREYIELGHARILNDDEKSTVGAYYLPHHCVFKPGSSTTKLRVVFDASAKTTTNLSLNDVLMQAPTAQSPLFDILLRFRLHKYVFSTDAQRMYEQVKVNDAHTKYQRCVWRDKRSQPLMDLELLRVTYGVGPSAFLATRSLVQLAHDERDSFPEASEAVLKCFYVNDALVGANTLKEAKKLREDIERLLERGGFKLHKWCANNPRIFEGVPLENREKHLSIEDVDVNGVIKTLGLLWDPGNDDFLFRVSNVPSFPTKRQVLSEIAKLFDPLGILSPIVVLAKLIMQRLWQKELDWDDAIPAEELETWRKLRSELCEINNMRIPRCVAVADPVTFELHGFSDASQRAYGCCIYLLSVNAGGAVDVKLICGKSRVAPLKELNREEKEDTPPSEMMIPRLELCAADLLAGQLKTVREALEFNV